MCSVVSGLLWLFVVVLVVVVGYCWLSMGERKRGAGLRVKGCGYDY